LGVNYLTDLLFSDSDWRQSSILSASVWWWEITKWTSWRAAEWYDGITSARSDQHQAGLSCINLKSHLFLLSYPTFWLFSQLYSARTV